jgi:plasmid maintenance system killer protein
MMFRTLRKDIIDYLDKHLLSKKWQKALLLFEMNPRHPSLHTELLEPKENLLYSFRIDNKYRAIFLIHEDKTCEVLKITNHYR